jgi:hypothetical protein
MSIRLSTWNLPVRRFDNETCERKIEMLVGLLGVHKTRWEGGGTAPVRDYTFNYGKRNENRPPLWSSGQSSWLQIQRSRFDSLRCQIFLRGGGSGTGSTQLREYN